MSIALVQNIVRQWFSRLQLLQLIAVGICLVLLWLPSRDWLHIFPPDNVNKWIKYIPLDFDRYYSGAKMLKVYIWIPVLFIMVILLHRFKKLLIFLMIPTGFLYMQCAKDFAKELEAELPFSEYLKDYKDYFAIYELYSSAYIYAVLFGLLFIYSVYILFRK